MGADRRVSVVLEQSHGGGTVLGDERLRESTSKRRHTNATRLSYSKQWAFQAALQWARTRLVEASLRNVRRGWWINSVMRSTTGICIAGRATLRCSGITWADLMLGMLAEDDEQKEYGA